MACNEKGVQKKDLVILVSPQNFELLRDSLVATARFRKSTEITFTCERGIQWYKSLSDSQVIFEKFEEM